MLPIGAFLLYAFITSTSAAPQQINTDAIPVLLDITGCMNFACEFRGFGGDCKYRIKPFEMGIDSLRENESEADLFARVERMYPLNTITIISHVDSAEVCNEYGVVCNSLVMIYYKQFIDYLKDPEAPFKPKLVCGDNDKPVIPEWMDVVG